MFVVYYDKSQSSMMTSAFRLYTSFDNNNVEFSYDVRELSKYQNSRNGQASFYRIGDRSISQKR